MSDRRVLVLGGAGFIGSHVVAELIKSDYEVFVIDGLCPETGGAAENLAEIGLAESNVNLEPIASSPDVRDWLSSSNVVLDLMALTSHGYGFEHPIQDAMFNLMSHVVLLDLIQEVSYRGRVVLFGSRGQYGRVDDHGFDESVRREPLDPQGVNKAAAERLFELYSRRVGFHCDALRITNCFGPRQKLKGDDIGLVGTFIKELLRNREIDLYGSGDRTKDLLFVNDLVEMVANLLQKPGGGFRALNVGGAAVAVGDLVSLLVEICGTGSYRITPFPEETLQSDVGEAAMDCSALQEIAGVAELTELSCALEITVEDFKKRLGE